MAETPSREPATAPAELPEFTLANVVADIRHGIWALIHDPFVFRIIAPIIIVATSILAKIIVSLVPYTEIDFSTYMQQIRLVNQGVIDYNYIEGDSGPIVYPGGFVQIYQAINYLTNDGTDIPVAQLMFGYVFAATNLLAACCYGMVENMPPWPLYLLVLSKRLFSIYVLRLFNDCFTTICMVAVCLLLQQASYWHAVSNLASFLLTVVAGDVFSVAISIKMNALLYLPGFVIVSYFLVEENLLKFLVVLAVIPFIQVMMGWKFLLPFFHDEGASTIRWNYINNAFNFSRKFLYEWTVNWRFVDETTFLSDNFAHLLLALHVVVLMVFIFTRYLSKRVIGKSIFQLVIDGFKPYTTVAQNNLILDPTVGPRIIFLILATSNVIGVLFSRSLHYQFLAWYCWQLPFLLFMTNWNYLLCFGVWIVHELCWNVFPSTPLSSITLVTILFLVLVGVWANSKVWFHQEDKEKKNV